MPELCNGGGKWMYVCAVILPGNSLTAVFSKIPVYSSQNLTSDLLLSLRVFQDAPECVIFAPQPPECWDYWCVPRCLHTTPFMFPVSWWLRNRPINVQIFFMQWGQLLWISYGPIWHSLEKCIYYLWGDVCMHTCLCMHSCVRDACGDQRWVLTIFLYFSPPPPFWHKVFLLNLGLIHFANLPSWPGNSWDSPISQDWS